MKPAHLILATVLAIAPLVAHAAPPPAGGKGGGRGGASGSESSEMQALLKSFNLSPEQQAKYAAAKQKTGEEMRRIHAGKEDGSLPQEVVLKQALASHKTFNATVKEILSPEQYAKWEPLREADHHKIASAHRARDEAEKNKERDKTTGPKP